MLLTFESPDFRKMTLLVFLTPNLFLASIQINDGIVLPDKASLYLTAIEDAEYKDDKIECELIFPFIFELFACIYI